MSSPYLGEIRMFSFGFAPSGWAECNGQALPSLQNQGLYSLLGATFGISGPPSQPTSFNVPDMRGRTPVHMGQIATGQTYWSLGQQSGGETVSLAAVPLHMHEVLGSPRAATVNTPGGNVLADAEGLPTYAMPNNTPTTVLLPSPVGVTGQGQPYASMPPFQTIFFAICINGLYPPRH